MPKYGADTKDVLATCLHLGDSEIDHLLRSGAVATQWSAKYIPGGDPWAHQEKELTAYMENTPSKARYRKRFGSSGPTNSDGHAGDA